MGITEELRWAAAKLKNAAGFAVGSAVRGVEVYAIVNGNSKSQPRDKKQNLVLVEEMQAKLEKTQEETNNVKRQSEISALGIEEQEHLKQFSDEPLKCSAPKVTGRRKIFIQSRL